MLLLPMPRTGGQSTSARTGGNSHWICFRHVEKWNAHRDRFPLTAAGARCSGSANYFATIAWTMPRGVAMSARQKLIFPLCLHASKNCQDYFVGGHSTTALVTEPELFLA